MKSGPGRWRRSLETAGEEKPSRSSPSSPRSSVRRSVLSSATAIVGPFHVSRADDQGSIPPARALRFPRRGSPLATDRATRRKTPHMSIHFYDTGEPADEEALAELEARVGHALPGAYRDFLEANDGAVPEANHLPDAASTTEVSVRTF